MESLHARMDYISLAVVTLPQVSPAPIVAVPSGTTFVVKFGDPLPVPPFPPGSTVDQLSPPDVLQVHSGIELGQRSEDVALFTGEPYSPLRHVQEQRAGRVALVYCYEGSRRMFGITPDFVRSSLSGEFDGATVVLMGCYGLAFDEAARAFIDRGARDVVGWDDLVSAGHTDVATEGLLRHLVVEGLSAEEAVEQTMQEIGPAPEFGGRLRVYASE